MKCKFISFILLTILFLSLAGIHLLRAQLVLKNKYLKITMDEHTGRFTIKTIEGNPYEKSDSNCDILDNTCWPPTTFASIKYSNMIYKFGSSGGDVVKSQIINDSLLYSWKMRDIKISQVISFCTINSNPSIKLEYKTYNYSQNKNNIGIRLCLDTAVSKGVPNYVDSSHSFHPILSETNYSDINEWYCLDSLEKAGVYLKFSIPGQAKHKPEKIIFSSWEKFDKNPWRININKEKSFYNEYKFSKKDDGAVGIFWEIPLNPRTKKTHSIILSMDNSKLNKNSLLISHYPETNIIADAIFFKIENNSLKNIENIYLKFETDKPDKIALPSSEIEIKNLPIFGNKIIQCPYSINANMEEDVFFKIAANFSSIKTSIEKMMNISTGKPKINISIVSNVGQDIIPLNFEINSSNCINPKKRYINIYNSSGKEICKTEISLEGNNLNKFQYQWDGKDNNGNSITKGAYYYYTTSFSNYAEEYFESEKGTFVYPVEPIITETNITYIFLDINFDYNSAVIKKYGYKILYDIAQAMLKYPDKKYLIKGHTDNTGDEQYNFRLSEDRAKSVFYYLVGQFDLNEENFAVAGHGSAQPAADNRTEAGRQKNRRVEIIIEK